MGKRKQRVKTTTIAVIYREIAANNIRRLNWRAMQHFLRQQDYEQAANCRDRVGTWNKDGPI